MNVAVIQPPLLQLNTPYPSGAYLKSFFDMTGNNSVWYELNICLFEKIFSRSGLTYIFESTQEKALSLAEKAERKGDEDTAFQLRRYVCQSHVWVNWIDVIVAILSGKKNISAREMSHKFIFSPFAPRGNRMENFISNLDHELSVDDSIFLATLALADLADYIQFVFDKDFSLVRYAESLTVNESSFEDIEKGLDSPVLKKFYSQVLEEKFGKDSDFAKTLGEEKTLVCISVPFAGTFTPALFTASYLKQLYGEKVFICAGGGFVNTELRDIQNSSVEKYFDAISYDRGYGSYKKLFENSLSKKKQIYKMRFFDDGKILEPLWQDAETQKYEDELTRTVVPDYSCIDFGRYPRMADDTNAMQRMWNDGSWMKAYLAHGCYWHQCDFCDVTLDYVCAYHTVDVEKLFEGLNRQCKEHGVYGIHFVDEALPGAALKKFALLNAKNGNQLSYWGNVRFEKYYSHDLAALLSYGGLTGVSAGIEIATSDGLDNIHKGTSLESIVSACCAFKEAGVLVHAYMIFGYWNEDDLGTINSMETLRQFYAAGLLDSSFWHKFVLTRHSRIYSEWEKGMHPNLIPLEDEQAGVFAKNTLHFKGEEKSAKFHTGLNLALESWMHGEGLNKSVNKWFDFKTPQPTVSKTLVEDAIQKYEERKAAEQKSPLDLAKTYWLGGHINVIQREGGKCFIYWFYMQEYSEIPTGLNLEKSRAFAEAVYALRPEFHENTQLDWLLKGENGAKYTELLCILRQESLVCL